MRRLGFSKGNPFRGEQTHDHHLDRVSFARVGPPNSVPVQKFYFVLQISVPTLAHVQTLLYIYSWTKPRESIFHRLCYWESAFESWHVRAHPAFITTGVLLHLTVAKICRLPRGLFWGVLSRTCALVSFIANTLRFSVPRNGSLRGALPRCGCGALL